MRKTFRMFLALALVMLGVTNVSAGDRIPVDAEHFTFHNYDGWGVDAKETGVATGENGNFLLDQADGCPIGDTNCNAWIDLGAYSKMYVKMAGCDASGEVNGSNPRIFINRTEENGQFNADKSAAKCLVIPNAGTWAEDYYTVEDDGTYVVDLTKIGKEWGFVHFHSIKGSAYNTKAIVNSIEVEKAAASQQIGWVNLINNSNMEGEDNSSFWTKIYVDHSENSPVFNSEIIDGIGVDGSRGIKVATTARVAEDHDNQFWFRFNEPVPAGTKYKVSFDYKADKPATVGTQAHAEPKDYIHYEMFGDLNFDEQWNTFTKEGEVTAQQSTDTKQFQSVAFNLSKFEEANNYYFDNITFEVYKYGTTVEFDMDVIQVDFGFDTNIPDLVKACGKPRLIFPEGTATVKVNDEEIDLLTVEGFADGRFYIFPDYIFNDDDVVEVTFKNPADPAYHVIYTSGPGGDANSFTDLVATNKPGVASPEDAYTYLFVPPVVISADPEDGSFNLPTNIAEFKITFDKKVDCAALVAKLGDEMLTVVPADGAAEEVTLKRAGGDLASGEYVLTLDKVYPEPGYQIEGIYSTHTLTLGVGKVNTDPSDVYQVIMSEDFSGDAPGWWTTADAGGWQPANSDGGSRIMRNQPGFAPYILYVCSRGIPNNMNGTAIYGNHEEKLTLKAKTYHLSLSAALWDSSSAKLKVQVFPADAVDEDGNADEEKLVAEEAKAIIPDFKTTTNATTFDIVFTAPAEGNYVLKFITGNSNGEPGAYGDGIALGNVKIEYVPSTLGAEETRLLNEALEKAKETHEVCSDERYAGEAFNALDAAIKKYDAEKDGYTAPSQYLNAVEDLNTLTDAMKTHRKNCDSYDENISKAVALVAQYGETKFKNADDYIKLMEVTNKYQDKVLTDDAELTAAVEELTKIVDLTSYMFTEGESTCGSEGIKVLVERIRLGAEALKSLGVDKDDELIVAANNTLKDDDSVAQAIKNRLTEIVYEKLKDPNNELFKPVVEVDDNTLEETTTIPTYDMTVFVKNPNIYALDETKSWSEENVPGWVVPTGNVGASNMWRGTIHNIEGLPADYTFNQWHQNTRIEQTIDDLPAGVYTIVVAAGNWSNEDGTGAYAFVKTSDTFAAEEGEEEQFAASIPLEFWGDYASNHDCPIENVTVTDGILTIGVNFGPNAQFEFDRVKLYLTAPADVDYASLYNDFITGVEAPAQSATVKAVELYNLDGRRITTARQGIVIVKKVMSDGTVRTEKVIKK